MLYPDDRQHYEEFGYVSKPSLLNKAEMKVVSEELERIAGSADRHTGVILEKDRKTLRSLSNPHLYSDIFNRLIRHPKLLSAAQSLLEEDVYVFQLGINCKAPFSGDIWFWHQDFPTYHCDDHIPQPRMVNTLLLVDEVSEYNAPLMLLPGSHKVDFPATQTSNKGTSYAIRYMDEDTVSRQVESGGLVSFKGEPGSVTFMHTNVVHGSAANLSPWPRRLITLTYNAISNKATRPSNRDRSIVYADRDLDALSPLDDDCLIVG